MGRGRGNRAARIRRVLELKREPKGTLDPLIALLVRPEAELPAMSLEGARIALQVAAPARIQEIRRA